MSAKWLRESNLIENVDDPIADQYAGMAWRFLLGEELTIDSIKMAHLLLLWPLTPEIGGHFRTCDVRVGAHIAPSFKDVARQMTEWMVFHKTAATEESVKEAHVEFERIHPFVDGNGRTGRIVMNWQRVKAGLEPLLILASERQDYYKWFQA